jgi:hypothetical protein
MNRIRILLLSIFVLSVLLGTGLRVLYPEERVDEALYLGEVAPESVFYAKSGTPPHYGSAQGTVAFNTYDITPRIRGYAGPIRLLVALDAGGRITGIRILEHKETPNYVHSMETPGFLGQFLGKSVNDPIEIDNDIDGVSRATVSVKALADTVRESSREVASSVLAIQVKGAKRERAAGFKWAAYAALFLVAMAAYFVSRKKRTPNVLRDFLLVASIIVVGIWLSTPFSILHVFNAVLLRLSTDWLWYAVVASTLISIIVAGRFYCGWLCPFGAVAEFLGKLPVRKWDVPEELDDRWRNAKYLLLALVMLVVIPTGKAEFGNYETYVTMFSLHGTYLMWVLVAVSLVANLRVRRFWCRFLCPVAALTGAASRSDRGYVSVPDCPMGNKPGPLISECIRCNRCYTGVRKE